MDQALKKELINYLCTFISDKRRQRFDEVIASRKKVLKELKDAAKDAETIFVATEPDREGEANGWHLSEELGRANLKKIRRLMFNEITKKGALSALDHPTDINKQMVDAQQARRVLDRLVGYKISPLLWDKVLRGLSAGRVQSVALKLVCDREASAINRAAGQRALGFFHSAHAPIASAATLTAPQIAPQIQ